MFSLKDGLVLRMIQIGSSQNGNPKWGATSGYYPNTKFRINLHQPGIPVEEEGLYVCKITGELSMHESERRVLVTIKYRIPDLSGTEVVFRRHQRRDGRGIEFQSIVTMGGGEEILVTPLRENADRVSSAFKRHGNTHGSAWVLGQDAVLVKWQEGVKGSIILAVAVAEEVSAAHDHRGGKGEHNHRRKRRAHCRVA